MFAADRAERQAAADDFQADAVFLQIDASEMRVGQPNFLTEFLVAFLAAADRRLLFGNGHGVPFFQVMAVFLQQDVAAARIGPAFGNNGDIADFIVALRIFGAVDETVQTAFLQQTETVDFAGDTDAAAECGQNGLRQGKRGVLVHGLDMDVNIVLRGRSQTAAQRAERFDFAAFSAMAESRPGVTAEGNGHAERVFRIFVLQGLQRFQAFAAGGFDIVLPVCKNVCFDKNARFAVVGNNGGLGMIHDSDSLFGYLSIILCFITYKLNCGGRLKRRPQYFGRKAAGQFSSRMSFHPLLVLTKTAVCSAALSSNGILPPPARISFSAHFSGSMRAL